MFHWQRLAGGHAPHAGTRGRALDLLVGRDDHHGDVGSLLGDAARGMLNLPEMKALDERVALEIRGVERIGGDVRQLRLVELNLLATKL